MLTTGTSTEGAPHGARAHARSRCSAWSLALLGCFAAPALSAAAFAQAPNPPAAEEPAKATEPAKAAPPARPALQLKPRDHEELGKAIHAYFEARTENEGVAKALEGVRDTFAKVEKRSKGVKTLLALTGDLGAAMAEADRRSGVPRKGVSDGEFTQRGETYRYAVSVPKNYNPNGAPYPLFLGAPDARQSPREALEIAWADDELRTKAILCMVEMPKDTARWTELSSSGTPGGLTVMLSVLRRVRIDFSIDVDRVYACGQGAGAAPASKVVATYPHVFAGLYARGGDIEAVPASNFRNVAVYVISGGANATALDAAIQSGGYLGSKLVTEGGVAEAAAWLLERPRLAHPLHVSLSPIASSGGKAYWLELAGFEVASGPTAEAQVDREANRITITGKGIAQGAIYLNDELVDLDRPVEVVCNGVARTERPQRNLEFLLGQAYNSNDASRVYTAKIEFDLPVQ
jgi:hypothetical protein